MNEDILRQSPPSPIRPLNAPSRGLPRRLAERMLAVDRLRRKYATLPARRSGAQFLDLALTELNVRHEVSTGDLSNLPASGPGVVVSNHPFGGVEGMILLRLLLSIRPDVRVLANYMLQAIPDLREHLISVDPFGRPDSARKNVAALKTAVRWLKDGHLLVVFPAGEVSHFNWRNRRVEDPVWHSSIARIVRLAAVPVIPVFFAGRNNAAFQLAGLVHPMLRTVLLPRQLLNKQGTVIRLRVGTAISPRKISEISGDEHLGHYLRFRTYLLGSAMNRRRPALSPLRRVVRPRTPPPVIAALNPAVMAEEIRTLPERQTLLKSEGCQVVYARAAQIPTVLQEIGRLREITFRAAGEGTGEAVDLDRFDDHYLHLFVWNQARQEIVGAYRLGQTDRILKRRGLAGLYTHNLFRFRPGLLRQLGPALEMGRSFVRAEYQKSYAPLLLLWKGIGHYVARHPRYKVLFGPVSIASDYHSVSRRLMVAFLQLNNFLPDLASLVSPPHPLRPRAVAGLKPGLADAWPKDIDELSTWISDVEADGKGIPILLKQYLKLGGKLLSFNVDPDFNDALDGLIMVDLTRTEPRILKRYMSAEGLEQFLAYHRPGEAPPLPADTEPALCLSVS
ncbi:MAG: lysophospholipid acyltransferase family protein [Acidobacteria bacterium]|nr:lysophospholipid acyltransferase family protein [Acidobacteriota bacterium]